MSQRQLLSQPEIQSRLHNLRGWQLKEGKLHRTFEFGNFVDAFAFMTKTAMAAEKLNHHPEWHNVYNKVTVDLTTHDLGGISTCDFQLAEMMQRFV